MSKGHGVSSYTHTQQQLDDYANQHNPNNHAYAWQLVNRNNRRDKLPCVERSKGAIAQRWRIEQRDIAESI